MSIEQNKQGFQIPLGFIQTKKPQLQSTRHISSWLHQLYSRIDFTPNPTPAPPQTLKRLNKLKTLLRQTCLQEKQLIDTVSYHQKQLLLKEKRSADRVLEKKRPIKESNYELLQVVNVDGEEQGQRKRKKLTYVDNSRMAWGEPIELDQVEDPFMKAHGLVPFEKCYDNKKAMFEFNKTLHEKDTYRFNVMWWEHGKRPDQAEKKDKKYKEPIQPTQWLDAQAIKSLKRNLKPLKRHKLVDTKYAPLSNFTGNSATEKDGIRDGKCIQSSSSEDQQQAYKEYDKQRDEDIPEGVVNLQPLQKKKRMTKKQQFLMQYGKLYKPQKPDVPTKLTRAINKLRQDGWTQDMLYTKGNQQDQAIQLQQLQ